MTITPVTSRTPAAFADAVAGFNGFLAWVSRYGRDLGEGDGEELDVERVGRTSVILELSEPLSASFNLGYDATDQSIYLAVEPEEFDWITLMPVAEVVIGASSVYVLTRPIDLDAGEVLPPVVLRIATNQPLLWRAFPQAQEIGFMCVRANEGGYVAEEFHGQRYPLRIPS